jgi:hypothetical protein
MRKYEQAGIAVDQVLLPKDGVDWAKWAVVACDQYTSEPEYWREVDEKVGDSPSTLRLIYPEAYLGEADPEARITAIRQQMDDYVDHGVLLGRDGMVYLEREIEGKTRRGIVVCVDLEHYDYRKGSQSLIRATEGTIVERLPPRVKIREGARLELPHIMVLVDDPAGTVIDQLTAARDKLTQLYDFDLMMKSGHLRGYLVDDLALEQRVVGALAALAEPEHFRQKYGFDEPRPVLLYAMGDGNHSLATAKAIWEKLKEEGGETVMDDPRRHALIELVNLHDDALVFEPIHRVVFGLKNERAPLDALKQHYGDRYSETPMGSPEALMEHVRSAPPGVHRIGASLTDGPVVIQVTQPDHNLAVGTLQTVLDEFMKTGAADELDYVHGLDATIKVGGKPGNVGFVLPAMDKHDLFKSVILDGALPRKTFSMGEAYEKRFYAECRALQ